MKKYDNVVIYGVGNCYSNIKKRLPHQYNDYFVCDKKVGGGEFEGHIVVAKNEICDMENCLVIIAIYDTEVIGSIKKELESKNVHCISWDEAILPNSDAFITSDKLREECVYGKWEDNYGNIIEFEDDIPDRLEIKFMSVNNHIVIKKIRRITESLKIICGQEGNIYIGRDTIFSNVRIVASYGKVYIGEDCMLSYGIIIRNSDGHHIFDAERGNRINYTRDIIIGNHVWVGQNVNLCPGFNIGDDSIVGAGAISSGIFPNNVIIAGNSAKIIRRNVTWNQLSSMCYNVDNFYDI